MQPENILSRSAKAAWLFSASPYNFLDTNTRCLKKTCAPSGALHPPIDGGVEPAQTEPMPVSKHRRKGKTRAVRAAAPTREREDDCPVTAKEQIAVLAAIIESDFGGEYYPAPTARSIRVLTRLKEMYGENVADWTDEQADAALAELTTKNRAA